ncbi:MAG TPA: NUDIX domain-containing protein [Chlamydiales bacterium]|jgi:ADP-ribose pyrophosphatase YjhB (NUDIX family)
MQHPESIAVILFNPERTQVLLIQRRDVPVWVLPGGGIELGERPEKAALREMFEETGFQVNIERLVGTYIPINRLAKTTLLFEVSQIGGRLSSSPETLDARFFPLSNLPPMPPPYSEWISDGIVVQPPITKKLTSVNYQTLFKYTFSHPVLLLRFLLARLGLPLNS